MGKKDVNSISSDPFEEYQRESDPSKRERCYAGHMLVCTKDEIMETLTDEENEVKGE